VFEISSPHIARVMKPTPRLVTIIGTVLLVLSVLSTSEPAGAIVGGLHQSPQPKWAALISFADADRNFCSGVMIRPQWVLTAAHCVDDLPSGTSAEVTVAGQVIGVNYTKYTGRARLGASSATYPDLAVLHLVSAPIGVATLPVATTAEVAAIRAHNHGGVTVFGYGPSTAPSKSSPDHPSPVLLKSPDGAWRLADTCPYPYAELSGRIDCFRFTRLDSSGLVDAGDSGGPWAGLIRGGWVVLGVVSGSLENVNWVNTSPWQQATPVYAHLSWLDSAIAAYSPRPKPIGGHSVFVRTWSWTAATTDGYKYSGSFSDGNPVHAADAPQLPGVDAADLFANCNVDSQTDAVIPISVTLTDDTPGFTTSLQFAMWMASLTEPELDVGAMLSNGPQCVQMAWDNEGSGSWNVEWPSQFTDGQGVQLDAYVIIPNYYSPANPNGSTTAFAAANVQIGGVLPWGALGVPSNYQDLTSLKGPGLPPGLGNADSGYLELNGGLEPD